MRHLLHAGSLSLLMLVVACNESPTLSGLSGGSGRGALVVNRVELLPGALPRRVSIDPASGATRGQVTWLPDAVGRQWGVPFAGTLAFSSDGLSMAWVEIERDTVRYGKCYLDACANDAGRRLFVAKVGASTRTMLTPDYQFDRAASFSPDGKRVVAIREYFDHREEMLTMNTDGSAVQPVLPRTDRRRGAPVWSPRGDAIAYVLPDVGALYLVAPDGTNPHPITPDAYVVGLPAWSADGSRIAVAVWNRTGEFDDEYAIAVLRPDGSLVRLLPFAGGAYRLQQLWWSPDGSRIAYCAADPARASRTVVKVASVSSGDVRVVTPAGYSDCNPIWRP